jgi:hypothetical protein
MNQEPYLKFWNIPVANVDSPPMTARIVRFVDSIYLFFGLYFVSLFSVCTPNSLCSRFCFKLRLA